MLFGTINKLPEIIIWSFFQKLQLFYKITFLKKWFVTSFLNRFSNFFQQIKGYFKVILKIYALFIYYLLLC